MSPPTYEWVGNYFCEFYQGEVSIQECSGASGSVVIPSTIHNTPVVSIGGFENETGLFPW